MTKSYTKKGSNGSRKSQLEVKHNGIIYKLKVRFTKRKMHRGHHGNKFIRNLKYIHFDIKKTNKSHEQSKDYTENDEAGQLIDLIEKVFDK